MTDGAPLVGVIMGSSSDLAVMGRAAEVLTAFDVAHEVRVVSAHRSPEAMVDYAAGAAGRGLRVIIAGAGGAAHLPGMVAAVTTLPVIGVPVTRGDLGGLDALLSMSQMPGGVPVATVGTDNAENAVLLAVRILANGDDRLTAALRVHHDGLRRRALHQDQEVRGSAEG